ncbi:protein CIP2A [Stigmatopora nigra]
MRMDATTCLKSLLLAMQQYEVDRNTDSAAELVEQVAEVSSLKWEHLLSSGQPLPSDCVRGLVELTGNATTCPSVVAAILSLLAQLAFDDDRRKILDCNFDLTGNLASLVHRHGAAPADPLVLQSLQLLQKLTYNTRVSSSSSYIYKLVDFLVANIMRRNLR